MLIRRNITDQLIQAAKEFQVIAILGPRQSGKTTLAHMIFPEHAYVSLEDYDIRERALADPRKFLTEGPTARGMIIDEIQHAPLLLSYMQSIVDKDKKNGFFIITGSQNFLVDEAITQTLAGRMAVMTLLPLSIDELAQADVLPHSIEALVYKGCYPKAYAQELSIERLYRNYIRLYVERDVRQLTNVGDLATFQKFMQLCAGRIGQLVNLTSLGNDCGINYNTAKAWMSILQASYVIILLYPYYNNFGKRMIKAPKLYFVDTGIACSLLRIDSQKGLDEHYLRGGLVESCLISDLFKQKYNADKEPNLYFWRDKTGHEVDCIIDTGTYPIPVEIKAGKTVATDFFKELTYWQQMAATPETPKYLIFGGNENQNWPQAEVLSWIAAGRLIQKISK